MLNQLTFTLNLRILVVKKINMKKEYKVEIIKEGALSTLLFGSSKLPLQKMTDVMNTYGREGWDISFQLIEKHRLLLFWNREAIIITFSRNLKED